MTMNIGDGVKAFVDRMAVSEIIENLHSNAIKANANLERLL